MDRVVTRGSSPPRPRPVTPPGVGHFYLSGQGRLYCLNETARQFLREGVPVVEEDLARAELITPEGHPVRPEDLPVPRARRERATCEATFLISGGQLPTRCLTWSAAPLLNPRGELVGVSATAVMTPQEPDWEELAGLAHDLRTPLQSLRLLVPLLESAVLLGPAAEALDRLRGAADRALALGQEVVDWCRAPLQGSGRRGEGGWVELLPLLEGLLAEEQPLAERKGLSLEADVGPALGLEVLTNGQRLGRLISNLLSNAVRYTATGRVRLGVGWRAGRPEERWLVLSVEDTGAGLAADEQESIFLAYHRGRLGRADSDSGGSGLGLNIVDRLVQDLGMTLEVHSEPGRGTRFDLLVPAEVVRQRS